MTTLSAIRLFNIGVIIYWIIDPFRNHPPYVRLTIDIMIIIETLFELMYMLY